MTPPAAPPPCITCVHYRHETVGPEYPGEHACTHSLVRLDIVTGRVAPYNLPCHGARAADGRCGPEGELWEAKG